MKELHRFRQFLTEDIIKEESIPSGWKKIDTSNDYEEEERQGRLMGFEAPMSGIEGDEVDNIYIEQDGDEYEVHVMTAFNNPEYEGPFNSKEEALKVAIQKMEDLKKDWDELSLSEGVIKENMSLEVDDDYIEISADSGEYSGDLNNDGTVDFSVVYDEFEDGYEEFDDYNWKDVLGPQHAFVQISKKIPTKVEAIGDYVMITVDLEDLKNLLK